jgi:hypothetical protein
MVRNTGHRGATITPWLARMGEHREGLYYTLWCSQVYALPNFKTVNHPCGASDGTENIFAADEYGNAQL